MNIVIAKSGICGLLLLAMLVVLYRKQAIQSWLKLQPAYGVLLVFWLLFRLVPFLILFILLDFSPTSDVNGFWDMASKAAEGQVVYRDFWSPYSPVFSYFLGLWTFFWYHPKVIVLAMLVMDGLAVVLSYRFYLNKQPDILFHLLLYFLLPGSLILCVTGAQEDVWIWLFIVAALLLRRKSVVAYSLALAFGVLITKAVFVLFLLPLFLLEREKFRFSWPLALVGGLTLLLLLTTVGTAFLQPVGEADTLRAPNLLSVINPWTFDTIRVGAKFWNWSGLLLTTAVGGIAAWRWRHAETTDGISRVFIALFATLMITLQSAYSNYIFIFLLPFVCAVMPWNQPRMLIFLFVYNVVCVLHPSYWWRLGMPKYHSPTAIWASSQSLTDYVLQVSIVVMTLWLIWYSAFKPQLNPIRKP